MTIIMEDVNFVTTNGRFKVIARYGKIVYYNGATEYNGEFYFQGICAGNREEVEEMIKKEHEGENIFIAQKMSDIDRLFKGSIKDYIPYIHTEHTHALFFAIANNCIDVVKWLHKNGADITTGNNFALRKAASNGNVELIEWLYNHGADIKTGGDFKDTQNVLFLIAASHGHTKILEWLYKHEIRAYYSNMKIRSVIQGAALRGYKETVEWLLNNTFVSTEDKKESIECAKEKGHKEIEDLLISQINTNSNEKTLPTNRICVYEGAQAFRRKDKFFR